MSAVVLLLPATQLDVTQGRATVTASVTNAGTAPERIVLAAFAPTATAPGQAQPNAVGWTTVERPLREIAAGATEQFTITVAPPPGTTAGHYPVRFIAYSADSAPEENADQARQLDVILSAGTAAPSPPTRPPWWIWVAAGALVLVVAVVAFLVIPRPTPVEEPRTTPSPSPPSSAPAGMVEAFSLNDYAGDTQKMGVGKYDDVDAQLTVGNDAISSFRVPKGMAVRGYEHAWFQGAYVDVIADTPALSADWNDKISSLIVYQASDGPPTTDYAVGLDFPWARWLVLPVGEYPDLARTPLGADTLSTLLVPRGLKVTLYDQANFAGEQTVVTGDVLDLGAWGDRAGSLKVAKA